MSKKVLIVEDDANIAELLHLYLEKEGFESQVAKDGGKGIELFRAFQPDLVLLDIMLPIMDGWSVLKKIREGDRTPVIMLTAKGETEDKVSGLEQGADDYIVKPFEMKEVLARIRAVLRRSGAEEEPGEKKLSFDKLVINLDSYELLVDGQRVGFDYFGDSRTVDVHIKRLREKLENVSDQWRLKTVWGVGYKFELGAAG